MGRYLASTYSEYPRQGPQEVWYCHRLGTRGNMNRYHNIHHNRKEKEFELMQIDLKCVSMANRMMSCLLLYRNSVRRIEVEWRCNRNLILPQPYPAQIPRKESILLSRRHCLSSRDCPSPFPIPYLSSSSEMRQRGTYSIHLHHSLSEKGRGR